MKQFRLYCVALLTAAGISVPAFGDNYREEVEYSNDKYKVETNRFWGNWFVGVGGGAQIYFGDHDKQVKFFDRLAPALDVHVGKWATPGFGVRVMYSGLSMKGATQKGALVHSTGKDVPGKGGRGYWLEKQEFDLMNLHADAMFNLSNLFFGFNEKRVWNFIPYVGLGWVHVWEKPRENAISGNAGIINTFRLCRSLKLNVDVRGMMTEDKIDGEKGGRSGEGMVSATIGLTYYFKPRGWDRAKTVYRYNDSEIEALQRRLAELGKDNERLRNELANASKAAPESKSEVKHIATANIVTFKIGKSKLTNEARVNLGMLAEAIKKGDKTAVYTITGYADAGTGNKSINERLSKARAEAVYKCLTEEFGVDKSQLRTDHKGGVDNMYYNDPTLSRAVITRAQ